MKICSIENCGKKLYSSKLCSMHYSRQKRNGTLELRIIENKNCTAPNCTNRAKTKNLCANHYMKILRTGTLDKLVYGEQWKENQRKAKASVLGNIDPYKHKKEKGFHAVNIVNDLKYKARQRGKDWNLTNEEAYKLIISDCTYCGFKPNWPNTRVGIDRVDNNTGYHLSNCVPCCTSCNSSKGTKSVEEFKQWITSIYSNLIKAV